MKCSIPNKKLIFIDPNFTLGSPAMKGIVRAVPELLKAGMQVEVWCWNHEEIAAIDFKRLPRILTPGILMGWAFFFSTHIYYLFWRLSGKKRHGDVLISTGFYLLPADVALIHFSTVDWIKAQWQIGFHTLRDWLELLYSILCRIPAEILLLWNPWQTRMVAVSISVGEDMKRWGAPWKSVSVLPNPYDPNRFNESVRRAKREGVRRDLGISEGEKVFVFASTGHYHRKGFWLAVAAISELRKMHSNARILVIGGSPVAVDRLKSQATSRYGDWSKWIHFIGMTTEMPSYLAAGDALLFPSYSEAFALVEIEAAAMGLRLYLTPHHGSEMILNEPYNGRSIPWEASGIAEILSQEIASGRMQLGPSSHGEAPAQSEYAQRLLDAITDGVRR